jgi:chorismate dehydratase
VSALEGDAKPVQMRVGRIPYINCYPVYGAIDRGIVPLQAELVDGVPTALNRQMAEGSLDVSVISAVEYAHDAKKYLLLPDLSICSDGPVRSVVLFSKRPASELQGRRVLVSRSSMTSVALLELLFENVWDAKPAFVPANAELVDISRFGEEEHDARLVIGDAALHLWSRLRSPELYPEHKTLSEYRYAYDLGAEWKQWTGLPFVFAVWVAQRTAPVAEALAVHANLIASRNWGLEHLDTLAAQAAIATGVHRDVCLEYLSGLDYGLSYEHLAGLTEFFRRLVAAGKVPNGSLAFLPAA